MGERGPVPVAQRGTSVFLDLEARRSVGVRLRAEAEGAADVAALAEDAVRVAVVVHGATVGVAVEELRWAGVGDDALAVGRDRCARLVERVVLVGAGQDRGVLGAALG